MALTLAITPSRVTPDERVTVTVNVTGATPGLLYGLIRDGDSVLNSTYAPTASFSFSMPGTWDEGVYVLTLAEVDDHDNILGDQSNAVRLVAGTSSGGGSTPQPEAPINIGQPQQPVAQTVFSVSGVPLNKMGVRAVTTWGGGRTSTPNKRGENTVLPGRSGRSWNRKLHDQGTTTLTMWVLGKTEQEYLQRLDALTSLLDQPVLVELRQQRPDGTNRVAWGELEGNLVPDTYGTTLGAGKVAMTWTIPDAYWRDEQRTTCVIPYEAIGGGSGTGSCYAGDFLGMTAPVQDAVISVTGPADHFQIKSDEAGYTFEYNAPIPAGATLVIDCGAQKLRGLGMSVDYSAFKRTGGTPLFCFAPGPVTDPTGDFHRGAPTLFVSGLQHGSAVHIEGYRKYLTL